MRIAFLVALSLVACGSTDEHIGSSEAALDTWSTIVNSTGVGLGARYQAAVTHDNNLVVVGGTHFTSDNGSAWIVRHTSGTTFTTDDTFNYGSVAGTFNIAQHLTVDSAGHTFANGYVVIPTGSTAGWHALTRMSGTSGTGTYETVDDVTLTSNFGVSNQSSAFYSGAVYTFANWENNTTGALTGHIRWSTDTIHWTDLSVPTGLDVKGMCSTGAGLMIVGVTGTLANQNWEVYATTNHSAWSHLFEVVHTSSIYEVPSACAQVGSNIYVSGTHHDTSWSWITRQAAVATPTSWSTGDVFSSDAGWGPAAIGPGASSRVFVAGTGTINEAPEWHVRRRSSTGTWTDSDSWQPTNTTGTRFPFVYDYAYASGIGTYVVGYLGNDAIVRYLAP